MTLIALATMLLVAAGAEKFMMGLRGGLLVLLYLMPAFSFGIAAAASEAHSTTQARSSFWLGTGYNPPCS